jgi:competence protein ComEC
MIRWIPFTFVRITIFLIAGIIVGIYLPEVFSHRVLTVLLTTSTGCYIIVFFVNRARRLHTINPGFLGLISIFLAGWLHVLNSDESKHVDHLLNSDKPPLYYVATLTRFAEEKEKSWKVEARMNQAYTHHWKNKTGRIVLYFSKQDFPSAPRYGDVFLLVGSPRVVEAPGNPGEFDYKKYLGLKNIYHQHFIRGPDAKLIGFNPASKIVQYATETRVWANETLKKYIPGQREQGVASALVLGVTDGLDNELLQAYAGTGAMHVLAVSGLHITIIYLIIVWILKPVSKLKSGAWIIAITSLIILWAYAFVTGLSPSVLRAVTMFSFLALAKPTNQSTNIYNTLAASAFCILMFDPFLILSVGFQLSYLAVLGIVYLHPKFYPLWEPENRILDEVWKITSVSIAAQIATLPLGLLYFHQFPNYFLISNLLVIPGSFVVLIGGLLVLISSFVSVVANVFAFLTAWMIKIINFIVFTVESFPYSLIDDIQMTTFQSWILAGIILCAILLYAQKKFRYVLLGFGLVVIFAIAQTIHFVNEVNVKKVSIYKVPGHTAIDFTTIGRCYFVSDSSLQNDARKIGFHIRPNRLSGGVRNILTTPQSILREHQGYRLIFWNNITFLNINKRGQRLPDNFTADFLIVSNNAIFDAGKIPEELKKAKIILDSSNSFYYADAFLTKAKSLGLDVYSILHTGSFEYRLTNTAP